MFVVDAGKECGDEWRRHARLFVPSAAGLAVPQQLLGWLQVFDLQLHSQHVQNLEEGFVDWFIFHCKTTGTSLYCEEVINNEKKKKKKNIYKYFNFSGENDVLSFFLLLIKAFIPLRRKTIRVGYFCVT